MLLAFLQPNIEIGQMLTPPAEVAGPWEELVSPGEVAGFSLLIITNANEKVRFVRIDTYLRKRGFTSDTYWSSGEAGAFTLRTGRLQFHQARNSNGGFNVTLDLKYDSNDMAWKGDFSDPFFSGRVALRRPNMSDPEAPAGTWRTHSDTVLWPTQRLEEYGCLNIGVGQDDALVLWAEEHNMFLGGDMQRPLFGDSYGELYDDSHAKRYGDEWSFTAGTALGGDQITGTPNSDRSAFGGFSVHYGNGAVDPSHPRRAFAWTRMLNLACRP